MANQAPVGGDRTRPTGLLPRVRRSGRIDRFLLFPLVCPAVLLSAGNDAFGFDLPGWVDPYVYLGYFWHYAEHLWVFDDNSNYKISRLPWILPGVLAHSVLSPVAAARLLAYCTLSSAALAVYLHARDALKDRHSAAFASVVLACCTWMHGPGGWYYHSLAAAGFYLWACWMVTRAGTDVNPAAWAAGGGALFAAAVHTHLFLVVFCPLLVFLYLAGREADSTRRHLRHALATAAWAMLGAAALTAALSFINGATGGDWLFFLPQVDQALKLSGRDPYWLPAQQWLPGATYLVIPFAAILTGLISGCYPWTRGQRLAGTMAVLPAAALGIMCVFQFITRQTTLDYPHMMFPVYLHVFGAVAAAVCLPGPHHGRVRVAVLAVATALVLLPLLVFMPTDVPGAMTALVHGVGLAQLPGIAPPLLLALAGVAAAYVTPRCFRALALAVWIAIVNPWVAPQSAAYGLNTTGSRQEMLDTFRQADVFTHRLDPTLIGIKYWISNEELQTPQGPFQTQHVFDSFVGTRAWLTNLLARESPGLPIHTLTREHLAAASCVGILSSIQRQAPLASEMSAHYASLDEPLAVVAERQFRRGDFAFALTVLRPVSRSGGDAPQSPCSSDAADGR